MAQLKFYQKKLAASAEALLNAQEQVTRYIRCIIEKKIDEARRESVGNVFKTDAICSPGAWPHKKVPAGVDAKVISVEAEYNQNDNISIIKNTNLTDWAALRIKATLLCDPAAVLAIPKEYEPREFEILTTLGEYYHNPESHNDEITGGLLEMLGDELEMEYGTTMIITLKWPAGLRDLLDPNYTSRRMRVGETIINEKQQQPEEPQELL